MFDTGRSFQAEGAAPGRTVEGPAPLGSGFDVASAMRRFLPLVLMLAMIGAGLAYAVSLAIPPRYVSTAQVFIDPRGLQVLDNELTPRQQDSNTATAFVESQARIMTSQSVLSRVVDGERLAEDAEFVGGGAGWARSLLAAVGLRRTDAPETAEARERIALSALYERILVRRPERTFVIDITARAETADKAARLANAVAQAYIDGQAAARAETARRATQALTARLDDLRERVRVSEQRAEDFRRRNGLVGTRTQLVSEQQLTDANTQLANAQARVAEAQARFDQTQAAVSGAQQGGLSEAIASQTISTLRGQQAEARRRLADAQTEFGPRHPSVRNAQSQVADIDRAIGEELARIVQSARADIDRARASEIAQRRTVAQLTQQATDAGQAFVQLRELQREVDANRNLLNSFLARSRETGEFERLDTTNARVTTVAMPPRNRSFPPRGIVLAFVGFVAGALLGAGLAALTLLSERSRTAAVMAVAGERTYLRAAE